MDIIALYFPNIWISMLLHNYMKVVSLEWSHSRLNLKNMGNIKNTECKSSNFLNGLSLKFQFENRVNMQIGSCENNNYTLKLLNYFFIIG